MPKGKKRGTGTIRQLPSGKYQLRYTDPLGRQVSGGTYVTMRDAERALTRVENSISAGTYDADRVRHLPGRVPCLSGRMRRPGRTVQKHMRVVAIVATCPPVVRLGRVPGTGLVQ